MALVLFLPMVWSLASELANESTEASIYYTEPSYSSSNSVESGYRGLSELPGGRVLRGQKILERSKSPYVLREDLFIERDAELVVESGVEVRFAPMIGITVRGIVTARVSFVL